MTGIDELRRRILQIDEDLLRLWKERDEAARRIGRLKQEAGLPLQNFEAEKVVLDHAQTTSQALGLSPERTRAFVRLLIESALGLQERERGQTPGSDGRRALIIGGAGLMGNWFARFLAGQGFSVYVEDPRPSSYPTPGAGESFDLVIVATPPSTVPAALAEGASRTRPDGLLIDIASVKGRAAAELQRLAAQKRNVASLHPMFGPNVETLMGRNVLLLDCGRPQAVADARRLFEHTAAQLRLLPLAQHDALMAEVLGLSHATSLVFNEALRNSPFPFAQLDAVASTTFRKQTDVSREVAHENPDLYFEIQTLNPEGMKMLVRLSEAAERLLRIVAARDRAAFGELMAQASAYYRVPRQA